MKKILVYFTLFILLIVVSYNLNPKVKFYVHYGIWLPSYCNNFEFIESPNIHSIFGLDGDHCRSSFEINKNEIQSLVDAIEPESIWLRYSETDSTLKDSTLTYPNILPKEAAEGKINFMLWSDDDTKGDYYNIWIKPDKKSKIKVTISMPFT